MFQRRWVKNLIYGLATFFGVLILLCVILFLIGKPQKNIVWGITFSSIRAKELDFEPKALLVTILDDLHPKKIRIPAYWSEMEPEQGKFNFNPIEDLLSETDKRGTKVIVVLGKKQPRWPECHQPDWYNKLNPDEQDKAVLNMIEKAVVQLRRHQSVAAWQIENEPYFQYGPSCPAISHDLYKKEIALVQQLDNKPTIATDSGEKSIWVNTAASGAEIFGSTMYREAYYENQGKYVTYPLPWWTYNIKAGLVRLLTGADDVIGVELQAEPWLIVSNPKGTEINEQLKHMNPDIFENNIQYAQNIGFSENYLWGAEWWYWLQKAHNDSSMVNAAKKLFNSK